VLQHFSLHVAVRSTADACQALRRCVIRPTLANNSSRLRRQLAQRALKGLGRLAALDQVAAVDHWTRR
jgi:hypothetical protein